MTIGRLLRDVARIVREDVSDLENEVNIRPEVFQRLMSLQNDHSLNIPVELPPEP